MIVHSNRFTSGLSDADVRRVMEERAPRYRQVPGLLQKLYIRDPQSGQFGAIYIWDGEESMAAFSRSELARTIPEAYDIEGPPRGETVDVVYVLKPEETLPFTT